MLRRKGENNYDRQKESNSGIFKGRTDAISAIGFVNHFSLTCHHLLRLGKAYFSAPLDMIHIHPGLKLTGTDPLDQRTRETADDRTVQNLA